jgi:TonB-dependent SusC/RagA subfamily outer membrane receptor
MRVFVRSSIIILCTVFMHSWVNAQNLRISGKILDAQGQPMIGAAVMEKNTTRGTVTDIDGFFDMKVQDANAILEVSYTGYVTEEITVGNQTSFTITMRENTEILNEVVVTALGIKKEKAKLGYATQEVEGRTLQKATESNVVSSLTGKVAGLNILNKSNLFETPDIFLRGAKTLVVIDGVPSETDFWNISSSDIESVNVLKGTAAAALYGSQGINGAIMITTKKGKAGDNGVEISFNSSNQFQAGYIAIPEVQKTYGMGWDGQYGFVDGKGGGLYDNYGYVYGPKLDQVDATTQSGFREITQWNSEIDPATGQLKALPWISRGTNNLANFLRNQMITNNNLSIAGKNDVGDFRISVSHLYQRGQVPNTFLNTSTATLAGGLKLSDKVRAQSTISYNFGWVRMSMSEICKITGNRVRRALHNARTIIPGTIILIIWLMNTANLIQMM